MEALDVLLAALSARFGMQPVSQNATKSQVRLVLRIGSQHTRNWIVGAQHLLQVSQRSPWNLDLSRQYFLRGDVMVWGWRLILQHEDIAAHLPAIVQAVNSAPRAKFEVEEQALPGITGQRRMMNERGKGASAGGTIPMLIRQRVGGGVMG